MPLVGICITDMLMAKVESIFILSYTHACVQSLHSKIKNHLWWILMPLKEIESFNNSEKFWGEYYLWGAPQIHKISSKSCNHCMRYGYVCVCVDVACGLKIYSVHRHHAIHDLKYIYLFAICWAILCFCHFLPQAPHPATNELVFHERLSSLSCIHFIICCICSDAYTKGFFVFFCMSSRCYHYRLSHCFRLILCSSSSSYSLSPLLSLFIHFTAHHSSAYLYKIEETFSAYNTYIQGVP